MSQLTALNNDTLGREANVVFTFATAVPEEKLTMTVDLKILKNQD